MATATIYPAPETQDKCVPVEVYLTSMYHPDCDYVDGKLLERNVGELPHGKLQSFFGWYFRNHNDEWQIEVSTEQRVQVSATRYRIPDVSIISRDAPEELILLTPPVLCIEILSREDRMSEMQDRVEDYIAMGVRAVWVVDPWRRKAFSVIADGLFHPEPVTLQVPGSEIQVPVAEIFRELDRKKN